MKLSLLIVVADIHIQRVVLAAEETTVTQQVSHIPIKCQSRSWSQRGTKVNGSHHGDSPLLKPTGIQIATKSMPGPTNREHRKLIGVKTMSAFEDEPQFLLSGMLPEYQNVNYKLQRRLADVLPKSPKRIQQVSSCRKATRKQVIRHLQAMTPTKSKRFVKPPYSISRATSIDSDCCRLVHTASVLRTKGTNYALISFDQQPQVSQDHIIQKKIKIEIPRSMVGETLSW